MSMLDRIFSQVSDTGSACVNGSDAFLVHFVQTGDFANKDERSRQARYDYNFAALGVPDLHDPLPIRRQKRLGRSRRLTVRGVPTQCTTCMIFLHNAPVFMSIFN